MTEPAWDGPPLPKIVYARQEEARELVAEAARDYPPDPAACQRGNVVRLMLSMWNVTGTTRFPRGWTREVMLELGRRGCAVPNAKVLRWYRSQVADDPLQFMTTPGVPRDLTEDLAASVFAP